MKMKPELQSAVGYSKRIDTLKAERDEARRYLTDALDIIATRIGPVAADWYNAAKRAAGEETP